jgi:hypothetical protein
MKLFFVILFIASMAVGMASAVVYFARLDRFRATLEKACPEEWEAFAQSRPRQSKAQLSHEAFRATADGEFLWSQLPDDVEALRKRAFDAWRAGIVAFSMLVVLMLAIRLAGE